MEQLTKGTISTSGIYSECLKLPEEFQKDFLKIKELEREIQALKTKISAEYIWKDYLKQFPKGSSIRKIDYFDSFIKVYVEVEGLSIEVATFPAPPEPPKLNLYEQLARRDDFKTILNCGILSTEEKRKCLGLPAKPPKPDFSKTDSNGLTEMPF